MTTVRIKVITAEFTAAMTRAQEAFDGLSRSFLRFNRVLRRKDPFASRRMASVRPRRS